MKMLTKGVFQRQDNGRLSKIKLGLTLILGLAFSQSFAQLEITKHTINSGGGKMTGGSFEMNASIGQADASNQQTGGSYSLNGGFWHEQDTTPATELIFANGFE